MTEHTIPSTDVNKNRTITRDQLLDCALTYFTVNIRGGISYTYSIRFISPVTFVALALDSWKISALVNIVKYKLLS